MLIKYWLLCWFYIKGRICEDLSTFQLSVGVNMKTAICALSLVAFAIAAWPYYERVMDRIEMERVVKDENILVKEYNHCFLDKTECTFFPGRIKKILKEAIVTACAKCSPKQKYNAKIYYETLIPKYPEEFKELSDKYDLNPFPHTKPYMASKV